MVDKAHLATDELLGKMKRRLRAIYTRASREIGEAWKAYLKEAGTEIADLQRQYQEAKAANDDKLTRQIGKSLQKAKRERTFTDKRYRELTRQAAEQLAHVNETATAYINKNLPEVYAINYNATGEAFDGIGGYSFTLTDADTVRNLVESDRSFLPMRDLDFSRDIAWNIEKMNAEVLQGILQGEPIDKIADRLAQVIGMNLRSVISAARTMVTSAENKGRQDGFERAAAMGIILEREWIATSDGRTRDWHRELDGVTTAVDEPFENAIGKIMYPGDPSADGENVWNCFVGETKIASDSDVVRSYKHNYSGKIISIKTACGVEFSCTPNHPILTPNGWVSAELLKNGDNILVTFGEQNVFSRVNPNINHRFPRIDTIHKFGKKMRRQRTCSLSVNFHGDIPTTNVEIITHKRLLWKAFNATSGNSVNKLLFKLSDKTLSCFGSLFEHFRSICKSSLGFVCRKCKAFSFFRRSISHSCKHSLGTIANMDSVLTEYSINDLPADTVIDGELLDRLSCKVFLDTIVNVDVSVLSTHVYNLQTENGYYFVNSIIPEDSKKVNGIFAIAKNCRCTIAAKVLGFKSVR